MREQILKLAWELSGMDLKAIETLYQLTHSLNSHLVLRELDSEEMAHVLTLLTRLTYSVAK